VDTVQPLEKLSGAVRSEKVQTHEGRVKQGLGMEVPCNGRRQDDSAKQSRSSGAAFGGVRIAI
jgi:hypothetical protein